MKPPSDGGGFKLGQIITFSKNLFKVHYQLIAEYLECDELFRLSLASKRLYSLWFEKKFMRNAIDSFDGFFTQQFAKAFDNRLDSKTSDDLLMTSVDLTSISTVKFTAKDTKVKMDPTKTWPLIEQQDDQILQEMAKKRIAKYSQLNLLKKQMLTSSEEEYKTSGLMNNLKQSFEPLLREILLDTDQCTSNSHLFQGLGPTRNLDDENGNAGYDTDVYIMENFCYCFPYGQSYKGPIRMQEFIANLEENPMKVLAAFDHLMHWGNADISLKITQYLIRVFTLLCEAFNDELDYVKFQLRGKEVFGYIRAFA